MRQHPVTYIFSLASQGHFPQSFDAVPHGDGHMLDDMGIFRTTVTIEHAARRGTMAQIADVMVDTGSELTWVPRALLESIGVEPEWAQRFRVADGRAIERDVGFAIVHCAGHAAPDIVVFGDPGDVVVLGARSLEGLNLRIDVVRKVLVDAGPIIAGASLPRTAA